MLSLIEYYKEWKWNSNSSDIIPNDAINDWVKEYFNPNIDINSQYEVFIKASEETNIIPAQLKGMLLSNYKRHQPANLFMCDKSVVLQIFNYHALKYGECDRVIEIREYITLLPNQFEYTVFLSGCMNLKQRKMNHCSILQGFKERLRKYKKGHNWRYI